MLYDNLGSSSRILRSLAVFLTLSAATVIVAASLVPTLDVDVEQNNSPYVIALARALEVLKQHRWQLEGAPGAMDQLERFMETASQVRARRRNPVGNTLSETTLSELDSVVEFDLSDPIWNPQWNLQWSSANPFLSTPG